MMITDDFFVFVFAPLPNNFFPAFSAYRIIMFSFNGFAYLTLLPVSFL